MVYEIIGKVAVYIIGTLIFGVLASIFCDMEDDFTIFFGAWVASIMVFLWMILP